MAGDGETAAGDWHHAAAGELGLQSTADAPAARPYLIS
jgi:hypothetical protein